MAETTQLRVFVSHASEDSAFCHTIVAALRGAGADVWYDEHTMGSGRLADEILRELGRRPIFVLILSKHAFVSRWVKRETDWAEELKERDPSYALLPVTAGTIARATTLGRRTAGWRITATSASKRPTSRPSRQMRRRVACCMPSA